MSDPMNHAPFLVGYWMNQIGRVNDQGRNDPSIRLVEHEWPEVELAGAQVLLVPLTMDDFGRTVHALKGVWSEGPYEFTLSVPGNAALALRVTDQRLAREVGRCTFHAQGEGLKLVMPSGICEDDAFTRALVWPVMEAAVASSRQWHVDQRLARVASQDQANARYAEALRERGEPLPPSLQSMEETDRLLGGIDLDGEAPEPTL
jgi:hypothetical protein